MDVREKLAELVHNARMNALWHNAPNPSEYITGMLMEDGVTVQEWISVKDRLPEYEEPVMGWDAEMRDMGIVNFIYGKFFDILDMSETNVTHWMPLPQPPKGE